MKKEQMKVAGYPAQIDGKPNVARSAKLVISVFEASGYQYKGQKQKGVLLFYCISEKTNVTFWINEGNELGSALEFICERSFELGYLSARSEIRKTLGA